MRWRNTYYSVSEIQNGKQLHRNGKHQRISLVPPEEETNADYHLRRHGRKSFVMLWNVSCRTFIIGIGGSGSATNDAEMSGIRHFSFSDKEGKVGTGRGEVLIKVAAHIDSTCVHPALNSCRLPVACDVQTKSIPMVPKERLMSLCTSERADRNGRGIGCRTAKLCRSRPSYDGKDIFPIIPEPSAAGGMGSSLLVPEWN